MSTDFNFKYNKFLSHVGHNIVCVTYGHSKIPVCVAIECEDCCEVIDSVDINEAPASKGAYYKMLIDEFLDYDFDALLNVYQIFYEYTGELEDTVAYTIESAFEFWYDNDPITFAAAILGGNVNHVDDFVVVRDGCLNSISDVCVWDNMTGDSLKSLVYHLYKMSMDEIERMFHDRSALDESTWKILKNMHKNKI